MRAGRRGERVAGRRGRRDARRVDAWARAAWIDAARGIGLSKKRTVPPLTSWGAPAVRWDDPPVVCAWASGPTTTIRVRLLYGQSLRMYQAGAEVIASALCAYSVQVTSPWPGVVDIAATMRDSLTEVLPAGVPQGVAVDGVRAGMCADGRAWDLRIRGRHTLVVGCSGSGKGSVLWGVACGYAPAVHAGLVSLWGIDLKAGLELSFGDGLFTAVASTPDQALDVLAGLLAVMEARAAVMVGRSRLHEPTPGDPVHVLIIDELAVLTAYGPPEVRKAASSMLARILTQGRALGVCVIGFIQDARKSVLDQRDSFTQVVALRLADDGETRMVLGAGMGTRAPAHEIDPEAQGTGYVVIDGGREVARVRALWWPDDLIRHVAQLYPAPVIYRPRATAQAPTTEPEPEPDDVTEPVRAPRQRTRRNRAVERGEADAA